jgi:hypothetical protein
MIVQKLGPPVGWNSPALLYTIIHAPHCHLVRKLLTQQVHISNGAWTTDNAENVKSKKEFALEQAMKAQGKSRGIVLLFL